MEFQERNIFLGPNLYTQAQAVAVSLRFESLDEQARLQLQSDMQAFCTAHFKELEPVLTTIAEGDDVANLVLQLAVGLQNMAGAHVQLAQIRKLDANKAMLIMGYAHAEVAMRALDLARDIVMEHLTGMAGRGGTRKWAPRRDAFIRYALQRHLSPSPAALVEAASKRGIPWLQLNDGDLLQFGHGIHQRLVYGSATPGTRHVGVRCVSDRVTCLAMLRDLGIPVPSQRVVTTAQQAITAARDIGYPALVKPRSAGEGNGVSINLCDPESVAEAFEVAVGFSQEVTVEQYMGGYSYRMLVIDGDLVACARRKPPVVVGDGSSTISRLIDVLNSDPRRGIGYEKALTRIEMDDQVRLTLKRQGFEPNSVPDKDQEVKLHATPSMTFGGAAIDCTDAVHPDNRELAIRAAKIFGLDIAGVDLICDNISESFQTARGRIVDVWAQPNFRVHLNPTEGKPRQVGSRALAMMFPERAQAQVPIAAISGNNGKTVVSRMLAHMLKLSGAHVGMAITDGTFSDSFCVTERDMANTEGARMVLRDPSVEIAVLECNYRDMAERGLAFHRCSVAACLNITNDFNMRELAPDSHDDLQVKRLALSIAEDCMVINADDPKCLELKEGLPLEKVCLVSLDENHRALNQHVIAGGRAAVLAKTATGYQLQLIAQGAVMPLVAVKEIPATLQGKARHNIQNALFTAALGFAMGLKLSDLRHGLCTFYATYFQSPGRLNVYDEHPFRMIIDHAHTPSSIKAMVHLVEQIERRGKRFCVIGAPSSLPQQDIRDMAHNVAGRFDYYICRQNGNQQTRLGIETGMLLKSALIESGVQSNFIEVHDDEERAINAALSNAKADDLVVCFVNDYRSVWQNVRAYQPRPDQSQARQSREEMLVQTKRMSDLEMWARPMQVQLEEN